MDNTTNTLNTPSTKQWGDIVAYLQSTGTVIENLPQVINDATDEAVVMDLLFGTTQVDQRVWVLQAFLLWHISTTAPAGSKNTALQDVAKQVGISRASAYALKRMYEVFLLGDFQYAFSEGMRKSYLTEGLRVLNDLVEQAMLDKYGIYDDSDLDGLIDTEDPIYVKAVADTKAIITEALVNKVPSNQLYTVYKTGNVRTKTTKWVQLASKYQDNEPQVNWVVADPVVVNKTCKEHTTVDGTKWLEIEVYVEVQK